MSDGSVPARRPSAPTIYDVARECGVAPSTVSRAFARPGRVNAETAARIRATADRIGYRTNPVARALPSGRTGMVALLVGDITNPVNFEIIRGGEAAATEAGYTLLLGHTQESSLVERQAVERVVPLAEGLVPEFVAHVGLRDPDGVEAAPGGRRQPGLSGRCRVW